MFPVYCVDEGFLGARASRPHNAWHSLGQLLHLDRPATAPWPSFGLAVAVTANVTAARKVALMLSDPYKDAGGTPALPGAITLSWEESQKPSRRRRLMRWGVEHVAIGAALRSFKSLHNQQRHQPSDRALHPSEPQTQRHHPAAALSPRTTIDRKIRRSPGAPQAETGGRLRDVWRPAGRGC